MEKELAQNPTSVIKVALFGPESTGKTTLAKQLAAHYQTVWVPEYARDYLQEKWNTSKEICQLEDLVPIAKGQMQLENQLTQQANKLLICDTDLLETKVYSEAYFNGYCDPLLEKYALENSYAVYFLTSIDVPWEKDDLRDRPEQREEMFELFKNTLVKYNRFFVTLTGDKQNRFKVATKYINKLLKK